MLGATRIGHGVTATQDKALMEYMAKHNIAIEQCPTSNYQTATIPSVKNSPLPIFLENEICVSLNTDDPAVSNIDLSHEYNVAKNVIGMTNEQLAKVQENGVKSAFLRRTFLMITSVSWHCPRYSVRSAVQPFRTCLCTRGYRNPRPSLPIG